MSARHTVIIGEDELAANAVTLRDMESGEQQLVPQSEIIERLKSTLRTGSQ